MRIGIDLDLCVIKSDEEWYQWLQSLCGGENQNTPWESFKEKILARDGVISYNLAEYFPNPKNRGVSPLDYWRSTDTYCKTKPVEGAIEAISNLHKEGHEIIFITSLKGHSHRSKYHWVERHFEIPFSFIGTKEKWILNDCLDVMVDDRKINLVKFDLGKRVLFTTPYSQEVDCETLSFISSWEDFKLEKVLREKEILCQEAAL
jgi:5'(3')-deoxyribonucleotidase